MNYNYKPSDDASIIHTIAFVISLFARASHRFALIRVIHRPRHHRCNAPTLQRVESRNLRKSLFAVGRLGQTSSNKLQLFSQGMGSLTTLSKQHMQYMFWMLLHSKFGSSGHLRPLNPSHFSSNQSSQDMDFQAQAVRRLTRLRKRPTGISSKPHLYNFFLVAPACYRFSPRVDLWFFLSDIRCVNVEAPDYQISGLKMVQVDTSHFSHSTTSFR